MIAVQMKNRRLLFVCPKGHIFRSLAKVKRGRLCNQCFSLVHDREGVSQISIARSIAKRRGNRLAQTFVDGKLICKKIAA